MEIKVGSKYRHFKGHIIEVICIAKNSETLKEEVIYKHLDTNEIWARDKEMFLSKVDKDKYPEVREEYRFIKIDD